MLAAQLPGRSQKRQRRRNSAIDRGRRAVIRSPIVHTGETALRHIALHWVRNSSALLSFFPSNDVTASHVPWYLGTYDRGKRRGRGGTDSDWGPDGKAAAQSVEGRRRTERHEPGRSAGRDCAPCVRR